MSPALVADLAALTALSSVASVLHWQGDMRCSGDPVLALLGCGLLLAAF